ncbi:MAG TPA: arginine deiminase-related protein [Galbitalea sp.]
MSVQAPSAVVLIRPRHFAPNGATAIDNVFQSLDPFRTPDEIARDAYDEVTGVAEALRQAGVAVHLFEDADGDRPDAVFPNNWFSTHTGGRVAVYPMYSSSRRSERRADVIETLKREYRVQDIIDYSGLEYDDIFLEGTGAMVLDHTNRVAYVARSHRADPLALERFCTHFGYEPMAFDATDASGVAVYHTNVMMCIATDFTMIGLDMIRSDARRNEVAARLTAPGRELINLSHDQIAAFAGNAIELQGAGGRILALSETANAALTAAQRAIIERSCSILALRVPTIELAGGSVRCMIAGIHLDPRGRGCSG